MPIRLPFILKSLKSRKTKSRTGVPSTADLTLNISMPNSAGFSMPAISANASTHLISAVVQVGDLKITVSLKIAHIIAPAIFLGISTL